MGLRGSEPGQIIHTLPAGTTLHLGYFDANGSDPRIPRRPGCDRFREPSGHGLRPALSWAQTWPLPRVRRVAGFEPAGDLQRSGIRGPLENPLPKARRSPSWTSVVRLLATWPWATSRPNKPSFVSGNPRHHRGPDRQHRPVPRVGSASRSRWMASRPSSRRSIW